MSDPIEILVEIEASSTVTLRGSDRGKVLSDGTSWSNFLVYDASIIQRANDLGAPGQTPDSFLVVSYESIKSLHDSYTLSGKPITVRVGRGNDPSDYQKPATGTQRAPCYVFRGFVPSDWNPSPSLDRSQCRLHLAEPLGYTSFPVLEDTVNLTDYPAAPSWSRSRFFPFLFGYTAFNMPGDELFPMLCVDESGSGNQTSGDWMMGNLPIPNITVGNRIWDFAGGYVTPYSTLDDVRSFTRSGTSTRVNDVRRDRTGGYVETNRYLWYHGCGIGTTSERPLPGLAVNSLLRCGGHVLYWLLRYRGAVGAADIAVRYFYGDDAFYQIRDSQTMPGIYQIVDGAVELSALLSEIANNYLVVLRRIDGNRPYKNTSGTVLYPGETPVWTLADMLVKKPLEGDPAPLFLDPGWLERTPEGEPDIRQLEAHPLYCNSAEMLFGAFPAMLEVPQQAYYGDATTENTEDQTDRGLLEKTFTYRFNNQPDKLLADLANVEGLCSDRWGRWTDDDPVSHFGFSLRLPMGDVLPGDMLNFGRIAQGSDGGQRVYFIEQTQLSWQERVLHCMASRFRDRPSTRAKLSANITDPNRSQSSNRSSWNRYPCHLRSLPNTDETALAPYLTEHRQVVTGPTGGDNYYFTYQFKTSLPTLDGLRLVLIGNTNTGTPSRVRFYTGPNKPPDAASPWSGWQSVSGADMIYDSGSYGTNLAVDYTLTDAQVQALPGRWLWFTCEVSSSAQWPNPSTNRCALGFELTILQD